jgi:hypothetical protein
MPGARAWSNNVLNANPLNLAFIEIKHLKPQCALGAFVRGGMA